MMTYHPFTLKLNFLVIFDKVKSFKIKQNGIGRFNYKLLTTQMKTRPINISLKYLSTGVT